MSKEEKSPEGQVTVVPTKENASIEIIPFGTSDRIRLSAAIVRQMIAVPTRTGKQPDDNQCIKFIMLCQARHLNPFEGDAFMLGYDTQTGPQFSLITAHQVFLKRAEASQKFNGMESGVIVQLASDDLARQNLSSGICEREGDLVYDGEKLIGGWAKVYRKNLDKPIYRRLKLAVFNTGRSRWEKDPAGMIVKCAEADALRTSFPTHLGGLYIEEEAQPIDVGGGRLEIKRAKVPKLKDKNGGDEPLPAVESVEAHNIPPKTAQQPSNAAPTVQPTSAATKKKPSENDTPSTSSPTTLKRKQKARSPSETAVTDEHAHPKTGQFPPNQSAMLKLLSDHKYTVDDFMELAHENDWVTADETWPLAEGRIETFLTEDNRETIIAELDALKK